MVETFEVGCIRDNGHINSWQLRSRTAVYLFQILNIVKKFLINSSAFFSIFFCTLFVLFILTPREYYEGDEQYVIQKSLFKRIEQNGMKGNVLIGDSKPMFGLNAKCLNAVNFSLGASGPVEGAYIAGKILQNKTNHIDTLFISYGIIHLYGQEFFYEYSYYFNFINPRYLDSVRQIARHLDDSNFDLRNTLFSTSFHRKINNLVISSKIHRFFFFLSNGVSECFKHFIKFSNGELVNSENQFINGRLIVLPSDTDRFSRAKNINLPDEKFINSKKSIVDQIYLQRIVDIARAHNVKVVFIFMPYIKSKITKVVPQAITYLKANFGNNLYYDTTTYDDKYFRDVRGHLNVYGVKKFQNFLTGRLYHKHP